MPPAKIDIPNKKFQGTPSGLTEITQIEVTDKQDWMILKAPKGMLGKRASSVCQLARTPGADLFLDACLKYAETDTESQFIQDDQESGAPERLMLFAEAAIDFLSGRNLPESSPTFQLLSAAARRRNTWPIMASISQIQDPELKRVKKLGLGKATGKRKSNHEKNDPINEVADLLMQDISYHLNKCRRNSTSKQSISFKFDIDSWLEHASACLDLKYGSPKAFWTTFSNLKEGALEFSSPLLAVITFPKRPARTQTKKEHDSKRRPRLTSIDWVFAHDNKPLRDRIYNANNDLKSEPAKYNRFKREVLKVMKRRLRVLQAESRLLKP